MADSYAYSSNELLPGTAIYMAGAPPYARQMIYDLIRSLLCQVNADIGMPEFDLINKSEVWCFVDPYEWVKHMNLPWFNKYEAADFRLISWEVIVNVVPAPMYIEHNGYMYRRME